MPIGTDNVIIFHYPLHHSFQVQGQTVFVQELRHINSASFITSSFISSQAFSKIFQPRKMQHDKSASFIAHFKTSHGLVESVLPHQLEETKSESSTTIFKTKQVVGELVLSHQLEHRTHHFQHPFLHVQSA